MSTIDEMVCSFCGAAPDPAGADPALTWCVDKVETSDGYRTRWVCPDCTRTHVRAIEAKLDQDWW
jgi:hypothetical protein